jgi:hypothetical protein
MAVWFHRWTVHTDNHHSRCKEKSARATGTLYSQALFICLDRWIWNYTSYHEWQQSKLTKSCLGFGVTSRSVNFTCDRSLRNSRYLNIIKWFGRRCRLRPLSSADKWPVANVRLNCSSVTAWQKAFIKCLYFFHFGLDIEIFVNLLPYWNWQLFKTTGTHQLRVPLNVFISPARQVTVTTNTTEMRFAVLQAFSSRNG